jgi:hypothetical protein
VIHRSYAVSPVSFLTVLLYITIIYFQNLPIDPNSIR